MKVRLIPYRYATSSCSLLFQFHEGSINTFYKSQDKLLFDEFQFHEGSINTAYIAGKGLGMLKFQFHEGSINTYQIFKEQQKYNISIP